MASSCALPIRSSPRVSVGAHDERTAFFLRGTKLTTIKTT
jgi:hypothetical protein